MTTQDDAADKAAEACPVCSVPMPADADRCSSCGATRGEQHKCPFCGVIARPQPHPEMRFVCPSCGAPRVPAVADVTPSPSMSKALGAARSARSSRAVWRLSAGLAAGFGLLAALLLVGVAMIASPAALPLIAGAAVAAMPFVFAVLALRNAAQRNEQVQKSLDEAWLHAAKELTSARGSLRNSEMAEAFGIGEDFSRGLLAQLASHSEVTTDVTDDGDLALSMRVPNRLRVANDPRFEDRAAEQVEIEGELDASDAAKKVTQ